MDNSWSEIRRVCDNDPPTASPISAITLDPHQELVWVGNDRGRVVSYYANGLQRYTSFKTHIDQQVRQLLVNDRGVISLGQNSLQMRSRRGLVKWTINNEDTQNLRCMTTTTLPNSEILVAGQQDNMLVVNVGRGTITRKQLALTVFIFVNFHQFNKLLLVEGANIVVMRKSPRLICCGSMSGEVMLRDPRTLRAEQRVQAHTGTLSDLDVSGNLLLTCGFSQRQGTLIIDPLVKVYDIRMSIRSLAPIPFPAGPTFLKMHPKLSTTVFITSQSGQYQMCDVGSVTLGAGGSGPQFYQCHTASYITAMDVSSSGETLVMGDAASWVFQFADREEPSVNAYSAPLEMPETQSMPNVFIEEESPLSLIGLPYYSEPLLSAWPANLVYDVGTPPPHLELDVTQQIKMIDFVGYAPNPGTRLRNQIALRKKKGKSMNEIPKFRSEQAREMLLGSRRGKELHEEADAFLYRQIRFHLSTKTTWNNGMRQARQCQSFTGVLRFSTAASEFYNKTIYGGLETHITNSYCNALLQVLYFTLLLRHITKSHIGQPCSKGNCLCCELGFLFRMLDDSKGQNCQASNFLKAFSTIPQAAALDLFEPDAPEPSLSHSRLIQNFTRFILEQLHQETNISKANPKLLRSTEEHTMINDEDGDDVPSLIQQLFGLKTASVSQCSQCGNEASRVTYPFVVDLVYPKKATPTGNQNKQYSDGIIPRKSFSDILHASLRRETPTKAFCTKCQQSQPMVARKILRGLPPVLTINSGVTSNEQAVFWRQYGEIPEFDITDGDTGVTTGNTWLPKRLGLKLNQDELIVKELDCDSLAQEEFAGDRNECGIYELTSVVSQIQYEKEIPHLVSHIRVPDSELANGRKSPWYLFNDFLVKNVSEQEVMSFKSTWKIPAVVQYTRINWSELVDLDSLPSEVDKSILFNDISISKYAGAIFHQKSLFLPLSTIDIYYFRNRGDIPTSYKILSYDELPGPGTLVAIDAEFVALNQEETEIRSDGTKSMIRPSRLSLARVSVLRGDNTAVPFIDDYIATSEPVVDYLTEFSGIEAGDLDPATSKHTLVPLKVAYKKLRLLVDMGCVFVGHGLKKDFRIINILVPPEQVIDTVDIYHIRNRQR
ncbi:LOW QUALITY PROTEIN: hypothetical protein BC937DRAFT_93946 [Endogone sp. FLAS-F59071]|nr:LOW QUALITY PROTEIN: hypothetical protein BC937DRAFT_93946 [Endogone sp. FLAS-F59071]|eukprot:RUS20974.1 LOW QUALITY PROTEIN: hypothetical protein BC937DRAFT_93946 [Endogone sp. FLAS-F59071]